MVKLLACSAESARAVLELTSSPDRASAALGGACVSTLRFARLVGMTRRDASGGCVVLRPGPWGAMLIPQLWNYVV